MNQSSDDLAHHSGLSFDEEYESRLMRRPKIGMILKDTASIACSKRKKMEALRPHVLN